MGPQYSKFIQLSSLNFHGLLQSVKTIFLLFLHYSVSQNFVFLKDTQEMQHGLIIQTNNKLTILLFQAQQWIRKQTLQPSCVLFYTHLYVYKQHTSDN